MGSDTVWHYISEYAGRNGRGSLEANCRDRTEKISGQRTKTSSKVFFEEIDKLEKTKLTVKEFSVKEEEYTIWALMALLCLGLEIVLRHTLLKKIFLKQKLIMFRFAQPEYHYIY